MTIGAWPNSAQCSPRATVSGRCPMPNAQCTMPNAQSTVHSAHRTLHSAHCCLQTCTGPHCARHRAASNCRPECAPKATACVCGAHSERPSSEPLSLAAQSLSLANTHCLWLAEHLVFIMCSSFAAPLAPLTRPIGSVCLSRASTRFNVQLICSQPHPSHSSGNNSPPDLRRPNWTQMRSHSPLAPPQN